VVVFSGYSTNKTDRHDITEILSKVALDISNPPTHQSFDVPLLITVIMSLNQFIVCH